MGGVTRKRRWLRRASVALGMLVLLFLLVRAFFADVYRIESGSMAPELFGPGADGAPAEWVLVRFGDASDIQRFDLVVVRTAGGRPMVKRVVGLPLERVQLEGGDLIIDGERLPPDALRPLPIDVYRDDATEFAAAFELRLAPEGPWSQGVDEWLLDAGEVAMGSNAGLALLRSDLNDDWISVSGEHHEGHYQVADGVLELEFTVEGQGGRLRFELREEGDTFQALIEPLSDDLARLSLSLTNRAHDEQDGVRPDLLLWELTTPLPADTWHHLRFANIDNALVLELNHGATRAELPYDENDPRRTPDDSAQPGDQASGPGSPLDRLRQKPSRTPRVLFGGELIRARFRGVRVARDRHWLPIGEVAISRPLELGPDQYFVLGDNSANSTDGRQFGPVEGRDVVGRPVAVVWPRGRLRRVGLLR